MFKAEVFVLNSKQNKLLSKATRDKNKALKVCSAKRFKSPSFSINSLIKKT